MQAYKGLNEIYRYLIVIVLVVLGYIIGQMPITFALLGASMNEDGIDNEKLSEVSSTLDISAMGLDHNYVLFLLLLMFVMAMIALYFGVTKIHRRPFLSIFTSRKSFSYPRFFWAFSVWMIFSLGLEFIGYLQEPENYIWQFQPASFFILILLVVTLLPIQTTFEEAFIRGYLLQGLGYIFRSRIGALLITSLIFGSMHMMNPEVAAFGWTTMMTYYVTIAIFLGALALLDDGLELSIGIHTATNMYGAVFVTFDNSAIQTPAVFRMMEVDPSALTIYSVGACVLFLLLAHWKYRFNWALLTGPYIPISWHRSYQDSVDPTIDPKSPEEIDISHLKKIESNSKPYILTTNLIQPQTFFKSKNIVDFEIAVPLLYHSTIDFVENISEEQSIEVLQKLQEFSGSDQVVYGDKLRLSLNDLTEVHLVLLKRNRLLHPKFENLNWEMNTLFAVPVQKSFYQTFKLSDRPKIDSIIA